MSKFYSYTLVFVKQCVVVVKQCIMVHHHLRIWENNEARVVFHADVGNQSIFKPHDFVFKVASHWQFYKVQYRCVKAVSHCVP